MLFIHKKSATPLTHWDALRHGGANNLDDAAVRGKYLVLWNVDIVHREGWWHYLFEFDVRNSLEMGALAQFVGKTTGYPNDMDWKQWLGSDCKVISAAVREAILNMPPEEARTDAVITDVREMPRETPGARPIPGRGPDDWYRFDLPREVILTLPEPS